MVRKRSGPGQRRLGPRWPLPPALAALGFRRFVTGLLVLVLTGVVGVLGLLVAWSPGRPAPVTDSAGQPLPGSISERVFIPVNGLRQGMIIRAADNANPVLLFLHGGPGLPEYFLDTTHPTGLEQDFTVVWWEQRGTGLSFGRDIPPETMTLEQFIADAVAVADTLRERFKQEKIYLLAHSWGSYLGIQVAAAAPDRFHAYVGMGQVSHQLRSEIAAQRYLMDVYRVRGDLAMVRRLEAAPVSMDDGTSDAWLRLRDRAMHRVGVGTTRRMRSVITGVALPLWRCRTYTLREKLNIWRGLSLSRRFLWDDFLRTDLTTRVGRLNLPVYFLFGAHDYTANHELAREYFERMSAPVKGFYTFRGSAHSPLFEEPSYAREVLSRDVLTGGIELTDR